MGVSTYTLTESARQVFGDKWIVQGKYEITVYGTDGIPVTPAKFQLGIIDGVLGIVLDVACDVSGGAVVGMWDPVAQAVYFLNATTTLCTAGALVITAYVTVMGS
jgi:hypothetical protein